MVLDYLLHGLFNENNSNTAPLIAFNRLDPGTYIQKAHRIVVLEQGRIVEAGTPEDLRKQSGLYARLARLQFEI